MWWWLGCWPGPLPPCPDCRANTDVDGDGVSPADGDCDDDDPDVRPGAVESCNGIDDDCDELVDVGAVDAVPLYTDADGDGYGTGEPTIGCAPAEGRATVAGDCDDGDPEVSPGEAEVCNDGVDGNCDGTPDDCEREGLRPLQEAEGLLSAAEVRAMHGTAVVVAEGHVVSGAPGWGLAQVGRVFSTPGRDAQVDGDVQVVARQWRGPSAAASAGAQMAWSPDGVVVRGGRTLTDEPAVYVVPPNEGAVGLEIALDDAAIVTVLGGVGDQLGAVLAAGPGGGLLMSSAVADRSAWWLAAPAVGPQLASAEGIAISGADVSALAVGDLDGDQEVDLVLGQSDFYQGLQLNAGAVHIVFGPVDGAVALSDADLVLTGPAGGRRAGGALAVVPDLDGDGIDDLVVGAPAGNGAVAWVVSDPKVSGSLDDVAHAQLLGSNGTGLGAAFAGPDLNGDGAADLAVSAPSDDRAGTAAGIVYVVSGPVRAGTTDLEQSALRLLGEGANHRAGTSLAAGDVDGDGVDDLVVGAPGESSRAEDGGGVHVWLGRGL